MHIKTIALTNRPLWINVQGGSLEKIEFRATAHIWPEQERNIALFLFEFDARPDQEALAKSGITSSAIGAYVYLNAPVGGEIQQDISLPPGTVKRIGIQLWNSKAPILLEDLAIQAFGAELSSEYAMSAGVVLNELDEFKAQPRPEILALSLMAHAPSCNGHCHAICRNWYDTMDDVARRYGTQDAGRVNGALILDDGAALPVALFNGTPAMLRIPGDQASYLEKVGDKARNMIRKAQRQGYAYKKVDPNDHLDDVLAIRTSDPVRQGKAIPDYYKVRPTQMIDEPFSNGCQLHGEDFFGIFKDDKLVAYTTIFFYGGLGQVNHILGHADHLQEGVMNLLVSEMVREIVEHRPWVRAINYLYPHASKTNTGIGLFKRSIGFLPERVLISHSQQDLSRYFSSPADTTVPKPPEPTSEKKVLRASTSKAVKVAAAESEFIQGARQKNRAQAFDSALRLMNETHPAHKLVRVKGPSELSVVDLAEATAYQIVVDEIPFEGLQAFLSGLKGYRKIIPKESFLLFDFKRAPDSNHVVKSSGLTRLIPRVFQSKGRRANQELMEYLSKRFKSNDLSLDDIKTGFKGSDYVLAGLLEHGKSHAYDEFDSILILKKIR